MDMQCKDRKKLTEKQLEEKRAYDRNRKLIEIEIESVPSIMTT
jgi:hypothetical protein